MYCSKCGTEVNNSATFCSKCGTKIQQAGEATQTTQAESVPAASTPQADSTIYYCPSCSLRYKNNYPLGCPECRRELRTFDTEADFKLWKMDHQPQSTRNLQAHRSSGHYISNHLAWSILATLFCCVPFGIVAIVYSSQVNGHLDAGRHAEAEEASNKAKNWCWASFGAGIIVVLISGILAASGANPFGGYI